MFTVHSPGEQCGPSHPVACGLTLYVFSDAEITVGSNTTWDLRDVTLATINGVTYELTLENGLEALSFAVPEPSSGLLGASALAVLVGLAVARRRSTSSRVV